MTGTRAGLDIIAAATGLLAAIALGLSAGGMFAEGAVLVPWWRSMPSQSFLSWYAANASRLFDFFGLVEIASAALVVAAGALYRYQPGASGGLFIASAVLTLAVLGAFPLYFQQVNANFAAGTIALDHVPAELARWAAWHWTRTTIAIVAFGVAVLGVRATGRADVA